MPTVTLGVYITDNEFSKYLERKERINDKIKELVKKELEE